MSNVIALNFPNDREEIEEVAAGLVAAISKKEVKAVVIITVQQGADDKSPHIRMRHGWTDATVSAYDLLALAAGVEHSKNMIHQRLDSDE